MWGIGEGGGINKMENKIWAPTMGHWAVMGRYGVGSIKKFISDHSIFLSLISTVINL